MLPRTIKRRLTLAVLVTAASLPPDVLWAQDARVGLDRPEPDRVAADLSTELFEEVQAMKRELQELRKSDAEKSKKIAELERRVEQQSSLRQAGATETGPLLNRQQPSGQEQKPAQKSALDKAIEELEAEQRGSEQESPLDRALRGLPPQQGAPPIASVPAGGGATLQLIDISLDALFAVGTSTATEPQILQLEGGDHDPHRRGFTVQNVELFLSGAVDPYFDAGTNIVYKIDNEGETTVELEEAYMTTRQLPHGLQVKAGQFFTEFGRLNPQHPHTWHFFDQPVIETRMFGGDGMRGPGMRLSWLMPTERFSEVMFGVQNANGETMSSFFSSEEKFEELAIGGRPFVHQDVRDLADLVYLLRWQTSWTSCNEETTWLFGLSSVFGPNATGPDGHTEIYGADLTMKWKPAKNERGWPFVTWETEVIGRDYEADNFRDFGDPLDPTDDIILHGRDLSDWGFYTQVLYGCKLQWIAGLRYEFATGRHDSLDEDFNRVSHNDDPFRDERHRLSPLVEYLPTEFSRIRVQYNFDYAQSLPEKDAHSFWLGFEWLYGAHAAHKF